MEWSNFLVFWLMGKWWVLENCDRTNTCLPMYPLDRRIRSSRSSCMMMGFFYLPWLFPRFPFRFFNLSSSFSSFLFLLFFFLVKPRKGDNIIYSYFKRGAFKLLPQTWYFFYWSMLVGLVKGFASKSINLTAPQSISIW